MIFCCKLLDALENTIRTLHWLTGADVIFLFMRCPETAGINNLKLNVGYKLGGFHKFIWSTFALTSSFSVFENMSYSKLTPHTQNLHVNISNFDIPVLW